MGDPRRISIVSMPVSDARAQFAELVAAAQNNTQETWLTRYGSTVAKITPPTPDVSQMIPLLDALDRGATSRDIRTLITYGLSSADIRLVAFSTNADGTDGLLEYGTDLSGLPTGLNGKQIVAFLQLEHLGPVIEQRDQQYEAWRDLIVDIIQRSDEDDAFRDVDPFSIVEQAAVNSHSVGTVRRALTSWEADGHDVSVFHLSLSPDAPSSSILERYGDRSLTLRQTFVDLYDIDNRAADRLVNADATTTLIDTMIESVGISTAECALWLEQHPNLDRVLLSRALAEGIELDDIPALIDGISGYRERGTLSVRTISAAARQVLDVRGYDDNRDLALDDQSVMRLAEHHVDAADAVALKTTVEFSGRSSMVDDIIKLVEFGITSRWLERSVSDSMKFKRWVRAHDLLFAVDVASSASDLEKTWRWVRKQGNKEGSLRQTIAVLKQRRRYADSVASAAQQIKTIADLANRAKAAQLQIKRSGRKSDAVTTEALLWAVGDTPNARMHIDHLSALAACVGGGVREIYETMQSANANREPEETVESDPS